MKTILLLHGAIGAKDQLAEIGDALKDIYDVHLLSFSGHGGEPYSNNPFSITEFAQDVLNYMLENSIEQTDIFGYSMGGYVGMYLAKHYPAKIGKLITLATKYHWDEAVAAKEAMMLDADKIAAKVPAFAEALAKRHAPNDWKEVLERTKEMLTKMGANNPLKQEDYAAIQHEVLVLLGDRDKMITLDETYRVYQSLPNAQMAMLALTGHPIEQTDTKHLAYMIKRFIA